MVSEQLPANCGIRSVPLPYSVFSSLICLPASIFFKIPISAVTRFHLLNVLNFDGQLRTSPVASQAWIRAQPMPPTSDLFLLLYDFQNLKVGMSSSSPSRASVANKANTVSLQSADHFSVAFKQLYTVHCNSWTAAARPTSFPGVDRLQSRPDRPLLDSPVAIQALNRFQNRVFAVAQIRVTVIAIRRHLPEFDPGDHRLKGGEGRLDFDFDGVFAIFERVWDHECQEERDYGLLKMIDEIRGFFLIHGCCLVKEENLGVVLVEKVNDLGVVLMEAGRKKEEDLCFVEEEAAIALSEEEEDFGCVEERRSMKKMRAAAVKKGKQTLTPNPISKHSVLYSYNWARWIPIGELGQKHNWALYVSIQFFSSQRLGRPDHLFNKLVSDSVGPCQDWARFKIINSFSFGDLGHQYIWATIAIDFPFQVP